jgi:hypothetical protein
MRFVEESVRTTLAIDDDVLMAAKELAETQRKSVGEVISSLARKALSPSTPARKTRNGILLLPTRLGAKKITTEFVRQLDEDLP